jgi:hypothetical protein
MSRNNIIASTPGEIATPDEPRPRIREPVDAASESRWRKLLPRSMPEIVLLGLVVLVMCLQLNYLLSVRTSIPYQDDWNFLDKMFRALDTHRVVAWLFDSPNGHFVVPAALGYLVSWRYFSLDLTALRLLNFPVCLAAFLLVAHVINASLNSRFLRFYLYAGASFVIFNLCFWEHFGQANGFSAMLSALFGGVGLHYVAKATQFSPTGKRHLLVGLMFLIASVLSFGGGYAAAAAGCSLLAFSSAKRAAAASRIPRYKTIIFCLVGAVAVLAMVSHPLFLLKSRVIKAAFHTVLVAGSVGSAFLDKGTVLAQNAGFACGLLLVVASLSICFRFLVEQRPPSRLLPIFSTGLVLFGLFACLAVAIARSYLADGEFLNSRYTPYSSIMLLGTLLYFGCSRLFVLTNVWCFTAATYLLATVKEQQLGFFRAGLYQKMKVAIVNVDHLPDEEVRAALYWRENTKGVRRVVTRMRREHLSVFRDGASQ